MGRAGTPSRCSRRSWRSTPLDGEALMLLGQHYAKDSAIDRAIFILRARREPGAV
jgi:hypothetical protein